MLRDLGRGRGATRGLQPHEVAHCVTGNSSDKRARAWTQPNCNKVKDVGIKVNVAVDFSFCSDVTRRVGWPLTCT